MGPTWDVIRKLRFYFRIEAQRVRKKIIPPKALLGASFLTGKKYAYLYPIAIAHDDKR